MVEEHSIKLSDVDTSITRFDYARSGYTFLHFPRQRVPTADFYPREKREGACEIQFCRGERVCIEKKRTSIIILNIDALRRCRGPEKYVANL